MFDLTVAVPELLLRAVLIYSAVFMLLRIVGKKHVGELAPFDLVVLLSLVKVCRVHSQQVIPR